MTRAQQVWQTRFLASSLLTAIVVAGCYGSGSIASTKPSESQSVSSSSKPEDTEPPAPESTEGCGGLTRSIEFLPFDTKSLASYGWGFVVADVVGLERASFNTSDGMRPDDFGAPNKAPINDSTTIYTPVSVVVSASLSGKASSGPSQFLIEGGTVGCFTMDVYPRVSVEPGSRYVLIVSDATKADGKGAMDQQRIMFAWPFDDKGLVLTVDGAMSVDELTELVAEAAPKA
jgi:hypothetical protein